MYLSCVVCKHDCLCVRHSSELCCEPQDTTLHVGISDDALRKCLQDMQAIVAGLEQACAARGVKIANGDGGGDGGTGGGGGGGPRMSTV
jgi:hypothetical protein